MSSADPRYLSYPTVLEAEDFEAILDQAIDPEASYRVEGWILRAMAAELLAHRAGRPRTVAAAPRMLPGQLSFLEESPR